MGPQALSMQMSQLGDKHDLRNKLLKVLNNCRTDIYVLFNTYLEEFKTVSLLCITIVNSFQYNIFTAAANVRDRHYVLYFPC